MDGIGQRMVCDWSLAFHMVGKEVASCQHPPPKWTPLLAFALPFQEGRNEHRKIERENQPPIAIKQSTVVHSCQLPSVQAQSA